MTAKNPADISAASASASIICGDTADELAAAVAAGTPRDYCTLSEEQRAAVLVYVFTYDGTRATGEPFTTRSQYVGTLADVEAQSARTLAGWAKRGQFVNSVTVDLAAPRDVPREAPEADALRLSFADFVATCEAVDNLPERIGADAEYMQARGHVYAGDLCTETLDDGRESCTIGRDIYTTGDGITSRDLARALYRFACGERFIYAPTVDASDVGDAFASALALQLGPDRMREVAAKNATAAYAGACASHDYCDANMVMADVLEDYGIDALDDDAVPLWNLAWDVARAIIAQRFGAEAQP